MEGTTSLSRCYRPKRFSDLIDQAHVRLTLEREIAAGRIGHAYLFNGPRGVGKTTIARIFAAAINCEQRIGAEPCGKCSSCADFGSGRALDLVEIDAASHTQVENVRENILPNARTRPSRAKFKVFIIDEVHMLSKSAFNALLKTIEEPPNYVVFILATTEVDRIPETVISRCQRFDFHLLSGDSLVGRLERISAEEKITIDRAVLETIAELAEGSVRDAESLLSQIVTLGEKTVDTATASLVLPKRDRVRAVKYLISVIGSDPAAAIKSLNSAIEDGADPEQFYDDLIRICRQALRSAYDKGAARPEPMMQNLYASAAPQRFGSLLRGLLELEPMFNATPVPQLPLELFAVEQVEGDVQAAQEPVVAIEPDRSKTESAIDSEVVKSEIRNEPKMAPAAETSDPVPPPLGTLFSGDAKQVWRSLLEKALDVNHGIAVLLNACQPVSLSPDTYTIACQFAFHRDRLNELKNRQVIEGILKDVCAQPMKFICVLSTDELLKQTSAPNRPPATIQATTAQSTTIAAPATAVPVETGDSTWEKVLEAFGT